MSQNSRSPLFLRGGPGSRKIHGPRYFCRGDPEVAKFTVPIIFAGDPDSCIFIKCNRFCNAEMPDWCRCSLLTKVFANTLSLFCVG